ncbi:uncharacterized protein MONBRDRAFT_8877 [Monosiga brevicollis MX1]|uniref:WW domain-containing protein n=1 Tax=Monosiga brevicollis TaxID=81824 RepID=A9V1E0_MONBE|nr:uncharacterized protein MONBRDRAFT_8877 [Monosiga brevicollis MX1]EDQ88550.1 predicted protein [Monosiga brevicollis MX1]|eukprot:XP_001746654.1 hypothetical protein [Monosiga brevicollis MX1]
MAGLSTLQELAASMDEQPVVEGDRGEMYRVDNAGHDLPRPGAATSQRSSRSSRGSRSSRESSGTAFRRAGSSQRSSVHGRSETLQLLLEEQAHLQAQVEGAQARLRSDTHSLKDDLYARNRDLAETNRDLRDRLEVLKQQTLEEIGLRVAAEREATKLAADILALRDELSDQDEPVPVDALSLLTLVETLQASRHERDMALERAKRAEAARAKLEAHMQEQRGRTHKPGGDAEPLKYYEEVHQLQKQRHEEMKRAMQRLQAQLADKERELADLQAMVGPDVRRKWDDDAMAFVPTAQELRLQELQAEVERLRARAARDHQQRKDYEHLARRHQQREARAGAQERLQHLVREYEADQKRLRHQMQHLQRQHDAQAKVQEMQLSDLETALHHAQAQMPLSAPDAYVTLCAHQWQVDTYLDLARALQELLHLTFYHLSDADAQQLRRHMEALDLGLLDEELPARWECLVDANGLCYYVDHETKTSSWIHPRFTQALEQVAHHQSVDPLPPPARVDEPQRRSSGPPTTYAEGAAIVAALQQQPVQQQIQRQRKQSGQDLPPRQSRGLLPASAVSSRASSEQTKSKPKSNKTSWRGRRRQREVYQLEEDLV